jgi:hypothetical protein
MHASVTVTPSQLPDLLLHVAVVRPVFVWGAAERAGASVGAMKLAYRAKGLITELAEISVEAAQLIVADAQDDATEDGSTSRPPAWFMVEIARDLPRIAARRNGAA